MDEFVIEAVTLKQVNKIRIGHSDAGLGKLRFECGLIFDFGSNFECNNLFIRLIETPMTILSRDKSRENYSLKTFY